MGNLLAYSGIVTKVRAMEAKLLNQEQFEKIANMHSVQEIVQYLKESSGYHDMLEPVEVSALHRGDIEKLLIQSFFTDYTKIYRFSTLKQREFLRLYLKRYEINLINDCLRMVYNHRDDTIDLNYKKPFFDRYSSLPVDAMIASRTTSDLVTALKGTEYYEPLVLLTQNQKSTLFDYDLALDLYYFTTVWKKRKKVLKKKELEIFTRDCGSKIDLLNLQWIYRAKRYYGMAPADIYSLLIPIHYKISTDLVKELVESPDQEAFSQTMKKTYYSRHYAFEGNLTTEKMYKECLQHLYMLDKRRNPYSIAMINTYLFLKEEELKKLTTAIECIRYSLTPGETLAYVGGKA